ncbi:MAG TPA: acetyl-CoA carboxylase biotin carboxyl carrier protein subunit [Ruminococcaceae bacterium]|nr:biotin/lipoyl-binding protein [Oscillospiraceae bacterium]HCC02795.1 acetyl-CoA carboxylase biotin carboxyl carrier protein subunit [Oscillospiraceae bacterium]HCM24882.1 acetyl-CoA carboxylase biotin carboxyl carrier protein subunit [Oscillospiraceae bacterium]
MKNLKVTVNGVTYDVQVEEQTAGTPASAAASAAPKTTVQTPAATVPAPAEKPSVAPAANQPAGNEEIVKSPMPGTIVDVKVQSGQKVKSGDVLLILEAMKMENEIMAPHDAVVGSILVTKGQSVESAAPLVSLR